MLDKSIKNIHILGIAGKMTAPLAVELKKLGYKISGSDQDKIYPPVSTMLEEAAIKYNSLINWDSIDLAVVGAAYRAFGRTKNEFEEVKKRNIPWISATNFVGSQVLKEKSVLVAGSLGKTTVSAILSWIVAAWDKELSYFIGGEINDWPSLKIGQSNLSIAEADESINGLDTQAKFFYYPVHSLILTAADWEHKEAYKSNEENLMVFKKLADRVPRDGIVVVNGNNKNAVEAVSQSKGKVVFYGLKSGYYIENYEINQGVTKMKVKYNNNYWTISTTLLGEYNRENILAALAMANEIGVPKDIIENRIESFVGVKRRLEFLGKENDIYFFDDFGQSCERVKSAMAAIIESYPKVPIKVFFEPHATFLQDKRSLPGLGMALKAANEVVLAKIPFKEGVAREHRSTAADFKNEIGNKMVYIPIDEEIQNYYQNSLNPSELLIHFSSGGLEGMEILDNVVKHFRINQNVKLY